jgi:phosphoserine phosphatase
VVEPIGELLGADRVVATRMVVGEDGCFTGEVEYYAYGPTKAEAIRELAASEGYDLDRCHAYSDSATDLPMLQAVGHPHAVNPDRALRREASARGWPILEFRRPVRLKQRLSTFSVAPRPVLVAAAAVGAAAATAGLVWYASRRRATVS